MLILIKKKNNNVDINKNMKTHPLQGPDQGPDQGSQTRCLYSFNNGKTKKGSFTGPGPRFSDAV